MTIALDQTFNEASAHIEARRVVVGLREAQPRLFTSMENAMLPLLNDLGDRVERVAKPMLNDARFMESKWRRELNKADVQTLIENILSASSLREWASSQLTPRFLAHYAQVERSTARVLIRAGLLSNLTHTTISQLLANGGRRIGLVDVTGDTRRALLRAITQSIEAGLSPEETARLIRDFVPEGRFVKAGSAYRARLIARTETLHAQRSAALKRYQANRIRMVIAYDGDSDATCLMRNGQEYTLLEAEDEMLNTHPQCVLAFGPLSGV